MKKVQIVCVGKIKEKFFADGITEYAKRLSRFCDFSIKELPDFPDDGKSAAKESESILAELDGYCVLLDINGKLMTSEEFAAALDKAFLTSPKVQIIIGGSRGVSDEVKARADIRISFGRMTFPHQLMRLIAAEQVYRAFTITANVAYHK